MPSVLDSIVIRIEHGQKKASVPAIAVIGDKYSTSLPDPNTRFTSIINDLQAYTKGLFRRKDPSLVEPTGNAFNNCNGQWTEYVYSVYAWNKLADIDSTQQQDSEYCYVYVKLPSNRNDETSWISLLTTEHRSRVDNFAYDETHPEVMAAGHKRYLLSSSNPDAVIVKVKQSDLGVLPFDPRTPFNNISGQTIENLTRVFSSLQGKVDPLTDIQCFISMKGSMRPDRRLQFLHEGNNVKSILLFLIEAYRHNTRNAPYSMDNLKKKFYAVAFDKVSENDQLSMEAAFIGAIHTDKVIWAVDRLFETLRPADVDGQIAQMI